MPALAKRRSVAVLGGDCGDRLLRNVIRRQERGRAKRDQQMQTILRPFPLQALYGRQLVALRGGTVLTARPIRPADADALRRLHRRLSETSIYLRYFTALPELPEHQARDFAAADGGERLALVVEEPDAPAELIALAQWDREPGTDAAEFALLIADDWQGRGLGIELMRLLVAAARER